MAYDDQTLVDQHYPSAWHEGGNRSLVWTILVDQRASFVSVSANALRSLGWSGQAAEGPLGSKLHPSDVAAIHDTLHQCTLRPDAIRRVSFRLAGAGHEDRWHTVDGIAQASFDPTGHLTGVRLDVWDISDRLRGENAAARDRRLLNLLASHTEEMVLVIDSDAAAAYVSNSTAQLLGFAPDVLTWDMFKNVVHPDDRAEFREAVRRASNQAGQRVRVQYQISRADGKIIYVSSVMENHFQTEGVRGLVIYTRDITNQRLAGELSALAARHNIIEPLRSALANRSKARGFALYVLKLDRFDYLSGALGRQRTDELLVMVSRRIITSDSSLTTITRLDSDGFAILGEDVPSSEEASRIAEEMLKQLERPFITSEAREIAISATVGFAVGPGRYRDPEDVLRAAEAALLTAREDISRNSAQYKTGMYQGIASRLWMEHDLRNAAERGELTLHYQPILRIHDRQLTGFEALVRWQHPERGIVSPSTFIPIAEETGLIASIGEWVLRAACQQLAQWQSRYGAAGAIVMNVNLSGRQLSDTSLADLVRSVLASARVRPRQLKLEVTETAIIEEPEAASATLHQLKALGVRLALDDFGTGYSSLRHLHHYPFDTLKVDKRFIDDLGSAGHDKDLALVRTILKLAESLKMDVVAEGIETPEQLRVLEAMDCGYGQGYLYAKPMPAHEAAKLFPPDVTPPPGLPPSMPADMRVVAVPTNTEPL